MNLESELRITILRKEISLTPTTTSTVDDMTNMNMGRARLLKSWETRYGSESHADHTVVGCVDGCEMPEGRASEESVG